MGQLMPPNAAEAIAVRFLVTLMQADAGAFALSDAGPVWVGPPPELPDHLEVIQ